MPGATSFMCGSTIGLNAYLLDPERYQTQHPERDVNGRAFRRFHRSNRDSRQGTSQRKRMLAKHGVKLTTIGDDNLLRFRRQGLAHQRRRFVSIR